MIQLYALLVLVLLFFSMSGDVTGCFLFPCVTILARLNDRQKGHLFPPAPGRKNILLQPIAAAALSSAGVQPLVGPHIEG